MERKTFDVWVFDAKDTWGDTADCINACGRYAILTMSWYEDSPGGQRSRCTVEICGECLRKVKNNELGNLLRQHRLEILLGTGFIISDRFFEDPFNSRAAGVW